MIIYKIYTPPSNPFRHLAVKILAQIVLAELLQGEGCWLTAERYETTLPEIYLPVLRGRSHKATLTSYPLPPILSERGMLRICCLMRMVGNILAKYDLFLLGSKLSR